MIFYFQPFLRGSLIAAFEESVIPSDLTNVVKIGGGNDVFNNIVAKFQIGGQFL
jgi:hypothetical protein